MEVLPVSVLIPTMNRPQSLLRTLKGYLDAEFVPSQIVLVDQSQDPEVAAQTKQLSQDLSGSTEITYVFQATPSMTGARNRAYAYAREEIVICSDDDIDVYPETIKNAYDIMCDPAVALIAGIDDNTATSSTNIGYLLGTKSFVKRKIGHVTLSLLGRYPDNIRGTIPTEWAMGYFFVIRKSLLDKWNIRWDEKLPSYAYAEDLDFSYQYCRRAKEEGLSCILTDRVRVRHLASLEYRIPTQRNNFIFVIHRAYLYYKHNRGFASFLAMHWCNFWRIVEHIVRRRDASPLVKGVVLSIRERKRVAEGDMPWLYEQFETK